MGNMERHVEPKRERKRDITHKCVHCGLDSTSPFVVFDGKDYITPACLNKYTVEKLSSCHWTYNYQPPQPEQTEDQTEPQDDGSWFNDFKPIGWMQDQVAAGLAWFTSRDTTTA